MSLDDRSAHGDKASERPGEISADPEAGAQEPYLHVQAGPAPRRRWAWIGTVASLLIVIASGFVLWRIAREVSPSELRAAFASASLEQIAFACALTALSYLALTGYDALALRQLRLKVKYTTTALASFTSYAVSFTLGFPLITGGTVRYWIYAPKGLSAAQVASLTVVAGITFWLGMGVVLGYSLILETQAVAVLARAKESLVRGLGAASLAAVAAYLVWVAVKRRVVRIQGWRLELPGLSVSLAQMCLGIVDVTAAAAVLYFLLPAGHGLSYETFLAIYVAAVMLGIASHAPGGIGVFEATMLLALSHLPREPLLGALLLFRLVYYLVPFILALACLGAYEIRGRLRSLSKVLKAGNNGHGKDG